MQLLIELSRSSQDYFESDSDLKESWGDWFNCFKSCVSIFLGRVFDIESIESIEHIETNPHRSKAAL